MTQPTRKRSGLGRGLASLIPTGPADGEATSFGPRMGDSAADVVLGGSTLILIFEGKAAEIDAADGNDRVRGVASPRPIAKALQSDRVVAHVLQRRRVHGSDASRPRADDLG